MKTKTHHPKQEKKQHKAAATGAFMVDNRPKTITQLQLQKAMRPENRTSLQKQENPDPDPVPVTRLKQDIGINDDPELEKEADVMGAKAMQLRSSMVKTSPHNDLEQGHIKGNEPVQRLIYDGGTNSLYTAAGWKNATNVDNVPVSDALNESDEQFADSVKDYIADSYGINPYYGFSLKNDFSALADSYIDNQFKTNRSMQLEILEEAWKAKNNTKSDGEANTFMNKMQFADSSRRYNAIKNLGADLGTIKTNLKAKFTFMMNQNYYLYDWSSLPVIYSKNPENLLNYLLSHSKSVLLPSDYLEKDSDSDVDFTIGEDQTISNPKKQKVCALISMIYQKAASVGTAKLAKQKIHDMMKIFNLDIPKGNIDASNLKSGKYLPDNDSLYDTLITKLHPVLQGAGTFYDLDKYSEQVLTRAGYTRIVSCKCSFGDLPGNMPPNIKLTAGASYVFHIEGHAMAVLMKRDIQGELGQTNPTTIDTPSDYYTPLNETVKNYNLDALSKLVTAIWKE